MLEFRDKAQAQPEPQARAQPQAQAQVRAPGPAPGSRVVPMSQMQQGMVKSMNHAATVPHFYLMDEFDITSLVG